MQAIPITIDVPGQGAQTLLIGPDGYVVNPHPEAITYVDPTYSPVDVPTLPLLHMQITGKLMSVLQCALQDAIGAAARQEFEATGQDKTAFAANIDAYQAAQRFLHAAEARYRDTSSTHPRAATIRIAERLEFDDDTYLPGVSYADVQESFRAFFKSASSQELRQAIAESLLCDPNSDELARAFHLSKYEDFAGAIFEAFERHWAPIFRARLAKQKAAGVKP